MKLRHTPSLLLTIFGLLVALPSCGQDTGAGTSTDGPEDHAEEGPEVNLDEGFLLSEEQIARAEITTQAAQSQALVTILRLPAVAEKDLDEQSHVNALLPGVVVKIQAVLGEEVETGDLMCTIRSAELAAGIAELRTERATLSTTLQMQSQEQALLQRGVVIAEETVKRERKMADEGFGTARLLADAETALQVAELARDRRALELSQRIAQQKIAVQKAEDWIRSWGFELTLADTPEGTSGLYSLFASAPGVVLQRHITVGEAVDSQRQLFLIQGMEEVWMLAMVFENQLRFVDEDALATVRFHAFPSMVIEGVVDHIHHDLEKDSRSVKARVRVKNRILPGRKEPHPLLPGMFGSIEIITGRSQAQVAVPASALLEENGRSFLFTLSADNNVRRRFVSVGLRTKDGIEILSGLQAGEMVVTKGVFILKSLLHLESIGEDED